MTPAQLAHHIVPFVATIALMVIKAFPDALFLKIAIRWVVKLRTPYWHAYITCLLANLLLGPLGYIGGVAAARFGIRESDLTEGALPILLVLVTFIIYAMTVDARLRVGSAKAALIVLAMWVIHLAAAVGIALVVLVVGFLIHLISS